MEEQQKKSTAEVLVECLKEEGVDTIFGIPGEETLDLTTMFAPITKRTKQIIRPDTVAEITRLAFKYAENEKPGATHIDLPKNIAKMPADVAPLKKREKLVEYASRKAVVAASELIKQAKVPVILAGNGAVRQHASGTLTEFVNRLHIPVVNTMMAKGIVSMDNPTVCGPWEYLRRIMSIKYLRWRTWLSVWAMTWWNVRRPSGTSVPAPKSYILPVSLPMSINVISRMWNWWAIFPTACRKF